MTRLLHQLITDSAERAPRSPALLYKTQEISYADLRADIQSTAQGLRSLGVGPDSRVAVYLPKTPEAVTALFAIGLAGGIFVPINPILKADQVAHILRDCNVQLLISSADRIAALASVLVQCPDLQGVVVTDPDLDKVSQALHSQCTLWDALRTASPQTLPRRIDVDVAAILYTSGSTGRPKGVVLTHRNMVAGADSVSRYLANTQQDRLLAVLPFSFDYGLSQLTTAFLSGASVALMDYLLPRDVIRAVGRWRITGLAAVPPLWNQLAALPWPDEARTALRYVTNSGGAMPEATLSKLREALPATRFFLMYGLTEAFRSTYLDPDEIDHRPGSIGKAIPNAHISVVRADGSECDVNEPGELVHRGAHVALGYWNDPDKSAERFKPAPGQLEGLVYPELVVWSGDQVRRDADGFLYFINRKDEMIKTSGYRVSPTEVEETVFALEQVTQVVALGVPHPMLGQAIVLVVQVTDNEVSDEQLLKHCRQQLPQYMVPAHIQRRKELPRNPNGKIDRKALMLEYQGLFEEV